AVHAQAVGAGMRAELGQQRLEVFTFEVELMDGLDFARSAAISANGGEILHRTGGGDGACEAAGRCRGIVARAFGVACVRKLTRCGLMRPRVARRRVAGCWLAACYSLEKGSELLVDVAAEPLEMVGIGRIGLEEQFREP